MDPDLTQPHVAQSHPKSTVNAAPGGDEALPQFASGYDLGEFIARGGMGEVYRGRDKALDRAVAIKILQPKYAPSGPAARRFVEEARITGQLQHPGIPPVHQVGVWTDGRPFLAMKLVKGETLDDLLKANSAVNHLAVFEAIAQAVGYAHAHGVVHRDLKPANVMVGAFGEVQVMDWGLAKVLPAGPERSPAVNPRPTAGGETQILNPRQAFDATQDGTVLGTPAYMPPEQALGKVEEVDARSDVFGLGAILCAILTGQPPYAGADTKATWQLAARADLADALARLDASRAEPHLAALCRRCLSPDKANRPPDANAVAQAVAGLRAAAEERARYQEWKARTAEEQLAEQRQQLLRMSGWQGAGHPTPEQRDRSRRFRRKALIAGLAGAAVLALACYWLISNLGVRNIPPRSPDAPGAGPVGAGDLLGGWVAEATGRNPPEFIWVFSADRFVVLSKGGGTVPEDAAAALLGSRRSARVIDGRWELTGSRLTLTSVAADGEGGFPDVTLTAFLSGWVRVVLNGRQYVFTARP